MLSLSLPIIVSRCCFVWVTEGGEKVVVVLQSTSEAQSGPLHMKDTDIGSVVAGALAPCVEIPSRERMSILNCISTL